MNIEAEASEKIEEAVVVAVVDQEAAALDSENIVAAGRKAVTANEDLMPVQEKCIKLPAVIVTRNVTCLLSQHPANQSTVENASPTTRSFRLQYICNTFVTP